MKKRATRWIYAGAILTALLQTGFLFASVENRADTLRNGKEITVATSRVDPRDLLRGDYVIVGYDFSMINGSIIEGKNTVGNHNIYVVLKQDKDGLWKVSRASFKYLDNLNEDEVQLLGHSDYGLDDVANQNVSLRFGIERYYVPEGEGLALEGDIADDKITAVLAVTDMGKVQIKGMKLDGKMIYSEPLY